MLGKLMKNEAKESGKVMLLLYGIIAAGALLTVGLSFIKRGAAGNGNGALYVIEGIFALIYLMTLILAAVAGFLYLCIQFYQTMYSARGYLTHTLPVSSSQILNTKITVAFCYLLGLSMVIAASMLAVAAAEPSSELTLALAGETVDLIGAQLGISGWACVLYAFAMVLLTELSLLLMWYAGASIGQLFPHSKGIFAVISVIAIYFIQQIGSVILLAALLVVTQADKRGAAAADLESLESLEPQAQGLLNDFLLGAMGIVAFWIVVYYIISRVIVARHLNLE